MWRRSCSQHKGTTAGSKGTFPYDKLVQIFLWSLIRPEESFCFGGSWRVPVSVGMLDPNFVNDLKEDGSYSHETFLKEYESFWGGTSAHAFFSDKDFDNYRILPDALWTAHERTSKSREQIIISYDVGRVNDDSSVMVFNAKTLPDGTYQKQLVNIFALEGMPFPEQATFIKRLMFKYNAVKLVIDGAGLGVGLIDLLIIPTQDENGTELPAFGVDSDSDPKGTYKQYYHPKSGLSDKIYIIKASAAVNSEMHSIASTQIASGKVHFLMDEQLKMAQFVRSKDWKVMSEEQRIQEMVPFKLTKILKEEMLNLRKDGDGTQITLKRIASGMKKDKFSSFEYGLWYIRQMELKKARKDTGDGPMMLSSSNGVGNRGQGSLREQLGERSGLSSRFTSRGGRS